MLYELTIAIQVKSPNSAERVARQMESVFEFGTLREAIAQGLRLREEPHLLGLSVHAASQTSRHQPGGTEKARRPPPLIER